MTKNRMLGSVLGVAAALNMHQRMQDQQLP